MGSLIGGAAIGALFGEALKGALAIINKGWKYESTLQTNIDTLKALSPLVEDITQISEELDRPREEVETLNREMQAGEKLVRRYSNLPGWKFLCFPYYQHKLQEGGESLRRTLSVNMQAQMARDVKQILLNVTNILRVLSEEFGRRNNGVGMGTALYGPPENPEFTVGLDGPLKDLRCELLKHGTSLLNLTGFGGSGKTTLAKKLCWDPLITGKFKKNIFFATFSKTPNLKIIVEKLFEHFEQPKPEFQSNEDPGYKLRNLLKQVGESPILLVLDDVWPDSDSELVENFMVQISDFKILVTSRVALDFQSCIPYPLELLSPEDSVTLFRHFAQLNDNSSYTPSNDLLLKAVSCCRGLPLALKLIGSKLRRKPIEFWQKMVKELSQGRSILDSDTDLLTFLQQCLDVLEDKSIIKYFMDLGLFPEDQLIPVAALFDMWTELYKLDEDFYAMPFIYELTTKNLSNLVVTRKVASDADNYYNNHFLTQHDLLRDLAIHLSKQKPFEQRKNLIIDITGKNRPEWWSKPKQQGIIARIFPKWLIKQKQQKVVARSLSISSDETFTSNWCSIKPDKAEVLVLNLWTNNYTLSGFIIKMRKLKVLIVTNYSFHPTQLKSFELLSSLSDLKRVRLQRVIVPALCRLKNLRKLSLYMCNTSQAFRSGTINIKDALPNLVDLNIDYCKDLVALPAGFCDITPLEKLSITNCHKFSALPQDIGKLENLEVLRLSSCTDLLDIPDSIKRLQKLSLLDISHCISLSRLPEDIGDLCNLSKLYMMGCSRLSKLPPSVTKLAKLEKVICDEEIEILWKVDFEPTAPRPSIEVAEVDNTLYWLGVARC